MLKKKRGRPRTNLKRYCGNFWRQKNHLQKKYNEFIYIDSCKKIILLHSKFEPCKKLIYFQKKFSFKLQYINL